VWSGYLLFQCAARERCGRHNEDTALILYKIYCLPYFTTFRSAKNAQFEQKSIETHEV
jgi:hypothetical protein